MGEIRQALLLKMNKSAEKTEISGGKIKLQRQEEELAELGQPLVKDRDTGWKIPLSQAGEIQKIREMRITPRAFILSRSWNLLGRARSRRAQQELLSQMWSEPFLSHMCCLSLHGPSVIRCN